MSASLNLMKLCVGCDDPAELDAWQAQRYRGAPARHVTRMWPKREAELLESAKHWAPVLLEQHPDVVERHLARWLSGREQFLRA